MINQFYFNRLLTTFSLILILFSDNKVFSQCNSGNETSCKCSTAPVLNCIESLDGFTYSMSSFLHPEDGPNNPMCLDAIGTTSHNPTWFAFIAKCTDLILEVNFSGCTDMQPGPGICAGLQAAVYSDCYSDWTGEAYLSSVACSTDGQCNAASGSRTLQMSDLTIGHIYYLLVDGCCGSACDTVTINVINPCTNEYTIPWSQDILGNKNIVLSQAFNIEYYLAKMYAPNINYKWTNDGEVFDEGESKYGMGDVNPTSFLTPGIHEICVDVFDSICFNYDDAPLPLCKSICVAPEKANAGIVQSNNSPACEDSPINIAITNNNKNAGFNQYMFISDTSGLILHVVKDSVISFTGNSVVDYNAWSYNYYCDQKAPIVGLKVDSLNCIEGDSTCHLFSIPISFKDIEAPTFLLPPANFTLNCDQILPPMDSLIYVDNCSASGKVAGIQSGSSALCGGSYIRTWDISDDSGNTTIHTQTINILPMPQAEFIGLPINVIVLCESLPLTTPPTLQISNGSSGNCLINETITPIITGEATKCGGTFYYIWAYTDVCNRSIIHTQTIDVVETKLPTYLSVPNDTTILCSDLPYQAPELTASNSTNSLCDITYNVIPIQTIDTSNCQGFLTNIWSVVDECGRTIEYKQIVNIVLEVKTSEVLPHYIQIAPNPFDDVLSIYIKDKIMDIDYIELLDIQSKPIYKIHSDKLSSIVEINPDCASGTLALIIQLKNGDRFLKKVVKR